ncbi:MAG: SPOR domain-containing protein, partial [Pseudomonas sp.]
VMASEKAKLAGADEQTPMNHKGAQTPPEALAAPKLGPQPPAPAQPQPPQAESGKLIILAQQEGAERLARDINTKIDDLEGQLGRLTDLFGLSQGALKLSLESLQGGQASLSGEIQRVAARMEQSSNQQAELTRALEGLFRETLTTLSVQVGRAGDAIRGQQIRLEALASGHAELETQQQSLAASVFEQAQELAVLKSVTDEKIHGQQVRIESLRGLQATQGEAIRVLDRQLAELYRRADELGGRAEGVDERLDGLDSRTDVLSRRDDELTEQLGGLAVACGEQRQATRKGLRSLAASLAGVAIALAAAITYLQFNPRAIPTAAQEQLEQLSVETHQQADLSGELVGDIQLLRNELRDMGATLDSYGSDMRALHTTLAGVQQDLGGLQARVKYPDARGALPAVDLQDQLWLAARDSHHYSIQLLGVSRFPHLVEFINRRADILADQPIAFGKGLHRGRDWYNLYYGDFATLAQAKAALAALPPTLRGNAPWIRSIGSIQRSAR